MTPAPKRRWLRFTLRTLFVVVTVFSIWLGWQASVVRERMVLRKAIEDAASDSFEPYVAVGTRDDGSTVSTWGCKWSVNPIPWYRRMLGDEPVGDLGVPPGWSAGDAQHLKRAFPEAAVSGPVSKR